MPKVTSLDELSRLKIELVMKRNERAYHGDITVTVGMGTCGIAAGALDVLRALEDEIKTRQLNDIVVVPTGCMGLCRREPILEVLAGDAPKVSYGKVLPDMVKRIVQEHIIEGKVVEEFAIDTTLYPTI